jgi:3-oxoadipate enol-lactonase
MMSASGQTTHTIEIDGTRLRYHQRLHDGETARGSLVLLHPWFGCWEFWRHTVEALPDFDTYAVDLYSLGEGEGWQPFANPHGLARAVTALMDELGLQRCSLMGNSMGGIAGQALAAAEGERLEKLILVGTGARIVGVKPDWRKALDEWIAGEADHAFTERLVDALIARRPEDPAAFETFVHEVANANKAFMGSVLTNAFALDLRPSLPEIKASTLVVRGALDAARTPTHVAELLAGIPGARAVEIPDAGHSPQVDSPEAFCRIVRDFLLEAGGQPS